jgi:hypothetical protein
MQVFLMHVGTPGNIDIEYTVTTKRSRSELLQRLPAGSDEEKFFRSDPDLLTGFPNGDFNCWGIPPKAEPRLRDTQIGDLVLFFPTIGYNGALEQIGIVKAKCEFECWQSSRILWPNTPDQRLFPYLFFFDTEVGYRPWFDFLDDVGYSHDFDPHGFYRRIVSERFTKYGGPIGYLHFLRTTVGFR